MKRLSFIKSIVCVLLISLSSVAVNGQEVYKTPSGAKYHQANCRMVKNVSEKITLGEAQQLGLEACKICKPVTSLASSNSSKPTQGESNTVQCSGKTRQGTRCKHMTRIGNGYCFQHQPKKN